MAHTGAIDQGRAVFAARQWRTANAQLAAADVVFGLHDPDTIARLYRDAGFSEVQVHAKPKPLRLPLPADFFWQDIHSTSLIEPVSKVGTEQRTALEEEVCGRWQALASGGALPVEVGMTKATAPK